MAKFVNGMNGPVRGKVGTIIGSSWKGIPYMKGLHKKRRTYDISKAEMANREKFGMAQFWLSPLIKFLRQGFKGYDPIVEGFIAAKSHLMKNAMIKTEVRQEQEFHPDIYYTIDPSLVLLSYGDLPLSENIVATKISDHQVQFTWDTTISDKTAVDDQVMVVAHNAKEGKAHFTTAGQFRSSGSQILLINAEEGHTFYLYAAFVNADRSRQSNSVYLGEITI